MNIKENIQRAKDRIKELEVLIYAWEATLPQKKFGEKNDHGEPTITTPAGEISETLMSGALRDHYEHSDAYYDYKRNDPNRENPFTDPKDRERAERVVNEKS